MKTPFAPLGVPPGMMWVSVGRTVSESDPLTGKPEAFATAWFPRPSAAALPSRSAMLPPFSPRAEAPTPMPSASESPAATA